MKGEPIKRSGTMFIAELPPTSKPFETRIKKYAGRIIVINPDFSPQIFKEVNGVVKKV